MTTRPALALAAALAALTAAGPAAAIGPGVDGILAFATVRSPDSGNSIYRINLDGSDLQRLTGPNNNEGGPSWSPDGSQIAFNTNRDPGGNFNQEVFTMGASGANQLPITAQTDPATSTSPAWSPDGTKIAFVRSTTGNVADRDIYVMNANGSAVTQLTFTAGADDHPDWSPDGSRIVFESERTANFEIFTMRASDGGDVRQLTNDARLDDDPSWSPDGRRIAFRRNDGQPSIWVMNADGSGQQDLAGNFADQEFSPAWSPEGTRIVFSETSGANQTLCIINADGTGFRRVFALRADPAVEPAWQPLRPAPAVSSVDPGTVTAGGPAFTLTVNGTGFTPGTVVRWNGANRTTTVVSTTRVTASIPASDVAAAGVARVSVVAPPPGGGTTAEFVVNVTGGTTTPPPPPGSALTFRTGTATGTWRANRLRGSLRLTGTLGRRASIRTTVRTARGKLVLRRTAAVPAGTFRLIVPLPATTLPGPLRVTLDEPRPPAGQAAVGAAVRTVTLKPPPQGVTERAFVTTSPQGAARSRVQRNVRVLYGVFRFAALPKKGRRFTVTWSIDGFRVTFPATRPGGRTLVAQIGSIGGGVLRSGRWTATLRSGGVVVTSARVRVG